ncbi:MAG: hypothetical protein GY778_15560 [bacterium]|nr:hypothetical protein [bacterium]
MSRGHDLKLTLQDSGPGRAVYVGRDGALYVGRKYAIFRSTDDGQSWTELTRIPCSAGRGLVSPLRLACRLLRHEVRALVVLLDGSCVASNREGVFYAAADERQMRPCRLPAGGVGRAPPMRLGQGPGGRVLWGEYFGNPGRREVCVCVSDDGGRTFEIAHVFRAGQVRHVHNIVYDQGGHHYWVTTGDFDTEPGIGVLSADLRDFTWLVRGEQRYRAVDLFDLGDHLVYGTDTELERNRIICLNKSDGRVESLMELEGSCIHACRFGRWFALSTTVERSAVNTSREAVLWLSPDGERWHGGYRASKDRWHEKYFQYGSIVLPQGASDRDTILFSGQALKGIDGQVLVASPAGDLAG